MYLIAVGPARIAKTINIDVINTFIVHWMGIVLITLLVAEILLYSIHQMNFNLPVIKRERAKVEIRG